VPMPCHLADATRKKSAAIAACIRARAQCRAGADDFRLLQGQRE
jgi:hypothetical protein